MAYTKNSLWCVSAHARSARRNTKINNVWTYKTTDAIADINTAGYFADAKHRNMQIGDHVFITILSSGALSAVYKATIADITNGAADITNGVQETITDSD